MTKRIDQETGEILERPRLELVAEKVKVTKVEKGGENLCASLSMDTREIDLDQWNELGRLLKAGPVEITLRSLQGNLFD